MVVRKASEALQSKKYCCRLFLDVPQAFDRAWHGGLHFKLKPLLPASMCKLIKSYLTDRYFQALSSGKVPILTHPCCVGTHHERLESTQPAADADKEIPKKIPPRYITM